MGAHSVQFYEDDTFLIKRLADYVGAALASGDTAIAIATGDHLARLERSQATKGLLNEEGGALQGAYIRLDADLQLPLFMDDGRPDEVRFRDTIGNAILDATEAHEGDLTVFGEMVALLRASPRCPLCPPVKHDAAIRVER